MPQSHPTPTPASSEIDSLREGDVIRIPQYQNPLRVCYVGERTGAPFVGLEFDDPNQRTKAAKNLIVNQHHGRVYLVAGRTDKGEVETIDRVDPEADR